MSERLVKRRRTLDLAREYPSAKVLANLVADFLIQNNARPDAPFSLELSDEYNEIEIIFHSPETKYEVRQRIQAEKDLKKNLEKQVAQQMENELRELRRLREKYPND